MTATSQGTGCPVCGDVETRPFFQLPGAPVFCNVLYERPGQARSAATADITLHQCAACGMIFNADFDPARLRYAAGYENSLYGSSRFREYATALIDELAGRYDLADRLIVEIGCGDGRFLQSLCEATGARGVGFDPSAPLDLPAHPRVEVRRSLFEPGACEEPFHLVVSRQVLEHIHRPLSFLRALHAAAEPNSAAIFIEVPNALWTLRDGGVWDIIYEHCSYFTPRALAEIVRRTGFQPIAVATRYRQQFLTIEALANGDAAGAPTAAERSPDEPRLIETFARQFHDGRDRWRTRLHEPHDRTVIWGTGSKGVTFLCAVDPDASGIAAAVDLNPRKHDRFTPVTGHSVIAPERLCDLNPHTIIAMNPIYLDEIRRTAAELGLRAEVVAV